MLRYLVLTMTLLVGMTVGQVAAQSETDLRAGVVKIATTFEGKHRIGTGFIVKTDGTSVFIVTAAHVVEGDSLPKVEFFTRQNTIVGAAVLKQDLRYDLALIKAELIQPLLVLKLESAAMAKTGDEVLTIGFPQGGGGWSISHADLAGREGADFILSGGAIDEGSSGGPLIKGRQVIGVVQGVQGKFARAMPASMVVGMLEGWGIALETEPVKSAGGDLQRATDAQTGSIDYSNFEQAKKAAERSDSRAMYQLAEMYADGKVVSKNVSEATKWLRRSADAGHSEAQSEMGLISLSKAAGLAGDDESAVHFLRDKSKQSEFISMILDPQTMQIRNQVALKESTKWLRMAADQGQDANAQLVLGLLTGAGVGVKKDPAQAAKWMGLAATKLPVAQALMGLYYFSGFGVEENFAEAARRLREAAEKDVAMAYGPLGGIYAGGFGVVQDDVEAAKWLRKGVHRGMADAKAGLSLLYFQGRGMSQDFKQAYTLAREAAEQGDKMGQYMLGLLFFSGKGVAQNLGESLKWMQAAARQGNSDAQRFLRERGQNW